MLVPSLSIAHHIYLTIQEDEHNTRYRNRLFSTSQLEHSLEYDITASVN